MRWILSVTFLLSSSAWAQGLVLPANWQQAAAWDNRSNFEISSTLPARWDWREHGQLPPVKNQGSCGSCWAFATTSVTESLDSLLNSDSSRPLNLAEQTLISTCSTAGSCGGGYFTAFSYIRDKGLPLEADDPYLGRNSYCRKGLQPAARISRWAYIGDSQKVPTTEQLKQAIYDHGPIAVGVNASLPSSRSGVVTRCGSMSLNHMTAIVGWVDDPAYEKNGGGYWIMRNSWGANWSEGGYMRIAYKATNSQTKCYGIGNIGAYVVMDGVENLREHLGLGD